MRKSAIILQILAVFLLGCEPDTKPNNHTSFEISFQVRAKQEDKKIFKNGIIPWISIERPESELARLIDPDEIVIKKNKVILVVDYPLKKTVEFELSSDSGFTRAMLIKAISKKYKYIYKKEQETTKIKIIPIEKRKRLINRNTTDGIYGVWGHDIGDLVLSGIQVIEKNGKIYLNLLVES